jgi:hypothetical protein
MIKFSLVCDARHDFESWFDSGASYDAQARRRLIACPVCNSLSVSKAMMAPSVLGARKDSEPAPEPSAPEASVPVALLDERQQKLRTMARQLRAEIEKNSVDVGVDFPKLARAIHEGDAPERSIRGKASVEEARALLKDGIAVLPLPTLPDEFN